MRQRRRDPAKRQQRRTQRERHHLKPHERAVAKALVSGQAKNAFQAGRLAGVHTTTAMRILQRTPVQEYMKDLLREQGITEERLAKKFNQLLDAKKAIVLGKGLGVIYENDNLTQLKALELISEAIGIIDRRNVVINAAGVVTDDDSREVLEQAKAMLTRYEEALHERQRVT